MRITRNRKAFTLVEMMVAVAITVFLITALFEFFNASRMSSFSGLSGQIFQDGANTALSKIIQGSTEPTGTYRLSTGVSYNIVSLTELHFWGSDNIERSYRLSGTSLIYRHPTASGTVDETIYTAPTGATLTLRFWVPTVANNSAAVVGIDVAVSQSFHGRVVTGSATTIVNLRNHP